jgi:hypothetical protein
MLVVEYNLSGAMDKLLVTIHHGDAEVRKTRKVPCRWSLLGPNYGCRTIDRRTNIRTSDDYEDKIQENNGQG